MTIAEALDAVRNAKLQLAAAGRLVLKASFEQEAAEQIYDKARREEQTALGVLNQLLDKEAESSVEDPATDVR